MDELRKRKAGLENAALMMAAEGVAVPPELSDELSQLVKSLAELSETSTVQKTWTSFLGEEIEGFVLREKISSGTYSHLFRAVHERTGEICAIKIARTHEPIVANPDDYFSKQAIRFHLELCQYVDVSPNECSSMKVSACKLTRQDISSRCYPQVCMKIFFTTVCHFWKQCH